MTQKRLALIVFFFGLLLFATAIGIVWRYTKYTQRVERWYQVLQTADLALAAGERFAAREAITEAAELSVNFASTKMVMRRAYEYRQQWDAPDILYRIVLNAAQDAPEDQKFWVMAVDAAIVADEPLQALEWARAHIHSSRYQNIVLEAVLRGGGIEQSDGSAFEDKLLLLSQLLENPDANLYEQAAVLFGDDRYALNAVLLYLKEGQHSAALEVFHSFPDLFIIEPALPILVYADIGWAQTAIERLEQYPPNPEQYFSLHLDRIAADMYAYLQQWSSSGKRYQELLDYGTFDWSEYANLLFVYDQAGYSYPQGARLILDVLQKYPDSLELAESFLRWYTPPTAPASPFEPELAFLHENMEQEYNRIQSQFGNNNAIQIWQLVHGKSEMDPRTYGARIWDLLQQNTNNLVLGDLYFFHAALLRDWDGVQALYRIQPESLKRLKLYEYILQQQWQDAFSVAQEIDPAEVDPLTQCNAGILLLLGNDVETAEKFFDYAIQQSYVVYEKGESIRSFAYTGKTILQILLNNHSEAIRMLEQALQNDRQNMLIRQVESYIQTNMEGVLQE